ncbi:SDR family oxidoreductase [Ferrovibrio sp.]|uniref:SDR family oxidoreductase n=1 Tax=Ferrovibrio sp. TaxID=1917215 RepID=UPI003D097C12
MKVVVIGGSGLIGSRLVKLLAQAGHEVAVASPSRGVNAVTGEGLAAALAGADVVVDSANAPSFEDAPVLDFFTRSSRNLAAAAKTAGVKHLVALSVVGTERLQQGGYFRAKLVQEQTLAAAGLPCTILRATQFHEFVGAIVAGGMKDGAVHLPPALLQPVAADDMAQTLADVVLAAPAQGMIEHGMIELGGPEAAPMADFAQSYFAAQGKAQRIVIDPAAQYFGIDLAERSLVPETDARRGAISFAAWLARQPK